MAPWPDTPSALRLRCGPAIVSIFVAVLTAFVAVAPAGAEQSESGDSAAETKSASDSDITVRTVERTDLQRDDARFPSGLSARVDTSDLSFRHRDLGDAVSSIPGVNVRRQSSRGQPARVSIRGGSSRQTAVHLDGLRLSAPVGPGFDVGTLGTGAIESVDVHRGSTAVSHGAGALTGALQLNPARAPEDELEWTARSRGGSFGTMGLEASGSVADQRAGLRIHGGHERSRGDFRFVDDHHNAHRRVNNDHHRSDVGATGHLETDDHRVRMTTLFQTGEAGRPGPSEFQKTFDGARAEHRDGLATLKWEGIGLVDNADLAVDSRATVGLRQRDHRYHNDEAVLTGTEFESRSTTRTAATTAGLNALIGESHLARLDAEHRVETHSGLVRNIEQTRLDATRHTSAISLSDHWLVADETLSLVGALRAEYSTGRDQTDFRPLLPAIGAIARLDPRLEMRANLTRTFRAPDFDELYLETETVRGNPSLDPEEAWTADTAVQLGADDDPVGLQLAYFHHEIDSTILFLPVSSRLFEARNLRTAVSRGLETAARARIADRWSLRASYTYTRARLRGDESAHRTQLPGRPRHRVAVDSTVDLTGMSVWSSLPEVLIEPSVRYRSRINLDHFGNLDNDPTLRADLGATVAPTDRWRAGLEMRNILDDRRARDSLHRPLPGRSIFASLEVTAK